MEGGETLLTPTASSAASHHHHQPQPPDSPNIQSSSTNLSTKDSDFVDEQDEKEASGYNSETIFGPVPSQSEVQKAMAELEKVMNGFSASNSKLNGLGQIIHQCDSRMMAVKSLGQKRILDAYHMLQTDPSVKRMVISISSDRAVWDAISENNAVQNLRGSLLHTATGEKTMSHEHEDDLASYIVKWIFGTTKSKIMAFVEKFGSIVKEMFRPAASKERPTSELDDLLEEKARSSVLLSVVIILIVVVTRSNGS